MDPDELDIPELPRELTHAVVVPDLKCRRCGYNLRGLPADGQCPECGFDIWGTIVHETDLEASQLPKLHDARGVGNGLFMLMLLMLVGAMLMVSGPLVHQFRSLEPFASSRLQFLLSPKLPYYVGVLFLGGLWSVWKLRPTMGDRATPTAWSDIRLLTLGLVGWSSVAILIGSLFASPDFITIRHSAMLVSYGCAASIFVGLRGIFKVIGERSRAYRRSREGRQNLGSMVAALLGMASGEGISLLCSADLLSAAWPITGAILRWVCGFMLILGLVYLTVNAWWIRRSMIRPSRSLDELLMPELEDEVEVPRKENQGRVDPGCQLGSPDQ